MSSSSETLHSLLTRRARTTPEAPAYTFLEDGEHPTTWSWGELLERARAIEEELVSRGIQPGDRVLLAFDEGLEFLAALFGCLRHGAVAVPVHPPDSERPERTVERIHAVVADCTPKLALGASVELPRSSAPAAPGLATLQYTSGSTAAPKGVRLTHAHFLHQLRDFDHGYQHAGGTVVSWLPATHDLGLVYGRLIGLYAGIHTVFFDPAAFVQHPRRWVEALTHYRGTHSPSPDFGFALTARRVTDTTGLDLSSVRVLLNGAEPIRRASEAAFVERFASVGLAPTALTHAMGMSEATAKIVTEPIARRARFLTVDPKALAEDRVAVAEQGIEVASNGTTQFDTVARIVDPETAVDLGEDRVGELWVSGGTVADGYWGQPDHPDFHGRIAGLDVDHLRTGDLGFLHQGELYLVGRRKDVLIVRGNNHHAPDLELAIEASHPAFRRNCSVAFSLPDQGVGFVAEVREQADPDELFAAMRKALGSFGLSASALWLAPPRTVLKTTSGKLRRRATGQALLDGSLTTLAHWEPGTGERDASSPRALLLSLVAQRTGLTDPPLDVPFRDLGLDSVSAVEVLEELGRSLGRELGVSVLFDHPTLDALLGYLEAPTHPSGAQDVDAMSEAEAEAALLAELEDL